MTENFDNKNDEELQDMYQGPHTNKASILLGVMLSVLIINIFIGTMFFDDIGIIIINAVITVIEIVISALAIMFINKNNIKNARILTFVSLFIGIILCTIDLIHGDAFVSILDGEFITNDIVILIPIINIIVIIAINKIGKNKESAKKSDWFYNK